MSTGASGQRRLYTLQAMLPTGCMHVGFEEDTPHRVHKLHEGGAASGLHCRGGARLWQQQYRHQHRSAAGM